MCYGDSARRLLQQRSAGKVVATPAPSSDGAAPTPEAAIEAALRELRLTDADVLYDLGCGDGRVVIEAARRYGCRAVGVEIDPRRALAARDAVRAAGLADRVTIYQGDVTKCDVSGATAAYLYLEPAIAKEVAERLPAGCRVASFMHRVDGINHVVAVENTGCLFFKLKE